MDRRLLVRISAKSMYRRFGPRYFHVLLVCFAASVPLLVIAGSTVLAFPYAHQSWSTFLKEGVPIALLGGTFAGAAAVLVVARVEAPLIAWLQEKPGSKPEHAWRSAVIDLPRAVFLGAIAVVFCLIPTEILGARAFGFHSPLVWASLALAASIMIAFGAAVHYLLWERALRPVVGDIARSLPQDFKPERVAFPLNRKLLVLILPMNLLTGLLAAGVSTDDHGPAVKFVIGFGVAVGVTVTMALILTLLLRRSITAPIQELRHAMREVESGGLEAHLLPTSADEIGAVAGQFNAMVEGLGERERLAGENALLQDKVQEHLNELQASRARIVAAGNEARRRVERDLHDGAQQYLVMLRLKIALALKKVEAEDEGAAEILRESNEDLANALEELRDLAHGIYPQVLTSDGLPGALEYAAARAALPATFSCDTERRFPEEVEAAVYFCCLEAMQNAAKHAGEGATARLQVTEEPGSLLFEVRDDGHGFDPASVNGSAGLQNMSDRLGALGGTVSITSRPGQGTRVSGSIPVSD